MRLTVTDGNNFHNIEVDSNEQIENVKALLEAQMGVPFDRQILFFQNKQLQNKQKLNELNIGQDSMLFLTISSEQMQPRATGKKFGIADMIKTFDKNVKNSISQFNIPKKNVEQFKQEAERIKGEFLYDTHRFAQMEAQDPEMAKAVQNEDSMVLAKWLMEKRDERIQKMLAEENRFKELSKDPMNPEYQKMLEERIHQENIDHNLQFANEYIPEVFGKVNMLYINATVNKVPIQAFVDSGAQSTIMSESLANRCGLMRLVDKRQAGTAVGVGTCKILGRIHAADLEMEGKIITCAFTVIENNGVDFLLGLDMLKRFSCVIDLKTNTLNFQNGMIITKFLGDGEIEKNKPPQNPQEIEEKVKKLSGMGFSHSEAMGALQSSDYNEEVAASMLMQRKYGK